MLELARGGANLKAAISYHGILTTHAMAEPGAVWVANYQIAVFGGAVHGFTDPDAADLQLEGVAYDALSNELSWNDTLVLLRHHFGS